MLQREKVLEVDFPPGIVCMVVQSVAQASHSEGLELRVAGAPLMPLFV